MLNVSPWRSLQTALPCPLEGKKVTIWKKKKKSMKLGHKTHNNRTLKPRYTFETKCSAPAFDTRERMAVKWKRPTSAVVLHEGKVQKQGKGQLLVWGVIWLESHVGILSPSACCRGWRLHEFIRVKNSKQNPFLKCHSWIFSNPKDRRGGSERTVIRGNVFWYL